MLLDFCVPGVCAILQIRTYCTRFIDNLLLNELLNLSCQCAVVKDDVASIRVYNCNIALTVNSARAYQSFADVCLPSLEGHSKPVFSRSLYAQASTVGSGCLAATVNRLRFRAYLCVQRTCRNRCTCVTCPSQPTFSFNKELARAGCGCGSTTAACSPCSNEPAPLPVPFFGFPLPPLF